MGKQKSSDTQYATLKTEWIGSPREFGWVLIVGTHRDSPAADVWVYRVVTLDDDDQPLVGEDMVTATKDFAKVNPAARAWIKWDGNMHWYFGDPGSGYLALGSLDFDPLLKTMARARVLAGEMIGAKHPDLAVFYGS